MIIIGHLKLTNVKYLFEFSLNWEFLDLFNAPKNNILIHLDILLLQFLFFFSPDEGCYKLVEAKKLITSPSQNVKHVPADETSDR